MIINIPIERRFLYSVHRFRLVGLALSAPKLRTDKAVPCAEFEMRDPWNDCPIVVRLTGEELVAAGQWVRTGVLVYVDGRVQIRHNAEERTNTYRMMAVNIHRSSPVWDGSGALDGAIVALTPTWIKLRGPGGGIGVRIGDLGIWEQLTPFRHLLQRGEAMRVELGDTHHVEWTDEGVLVTIQRDAYHAAPRILNSFAGVVRLRYMPNVFHHDGGMASTNIVEWNSSQGKSRAMVFARDAFVAERMQHMAAGDTVFVEGHFGAITPDEHGDRTGIMLRYITNDMTDPAVARMLDRVTSWAHVNKGAIKLRNRLARTTQEVAA